MFISRVIIKNFRSIESINIPLSNLNVTVGPNDIGKSNLLKAINLFFNGETEPGRKLDFVNDYCFHAPHREKKAKEIYVELHIEPPATYSGAETIRWIKTWRKDGESYNEYNFLSGNEMPRRSKIAAWLGNVKFKYVPAIKSDEYFRNLLGDLHDTLSETISDKLKEAGIDFIAKIRSNTEEITVNINKRLGFKSDIQLPSNLKELFKTLDFKTINGTFEVSLQNRGDGIKTRHIPVILFFLAEQENKNRANGSPKASTIWGYEEPENNLELLKCYDLAKEFLEYSNSIQIIVTSHSPAFYSLINNNNILGFFTKQSKNVTEYEALNPQSYKMIDEKLGILQAITPYITEEVNKREQLHEKIALLEQELKDESPVIFVEGITDFEILTFYLKHNPLKTKIKINYSQDEGGVSYVSNMIAAWAYSNKKHPGIGLFDKDKAGEKYFKLTYDMDKVQDRLSKRKVHLFCLPPSDHIASLYNKKIQIDYTIEHLFPISVWKHAHTAGWLEQKDKPLDTIKLTVPNNKSLIETLKAHDLTDDELIPLLYNVKSDKKVLFAKYVTSDNASKTGIYSGFKRLHDKLNKCIGQQ